MNIIISILIILLWVALTVRLSWAKIMNYESETLFKTIAWAGKKSLIVVAPFIVVFILFLMYWK